MSPDGSRVGEPNQQFEWALQQAKFAFHRLVLVVGHAFSGKTENLQVLSASIAIPRINLNLNLAQQLVELNAKDRGLQATAVLANLVGCDSKLAILDNTEILFDRTLALDPLRVLQGLSRNRTVVASWPGEVLESKLVYAVPGHPEFRSYREVDAVIIDLAERGSTEE